MAKANFEKIKESFRAEHKKRLYDFLLDEFRSVNRKIKSNRTDIKVLAKQQGELKLRQRALYSMLAEFK